MQLVTKLRSASYRSVCTALLPIALTAALLTVVFPLTANAQQSSQSSMPGMQHSTPGTIYGKDHPELIPDNTAYRLYLTVIGEMPNASPQRKERQMAFASKAPLSASDVKALIVIADWYKTRWTAMVNDNNSKVAAANEDGTPLPDGKAFLAQRDALVDHARDLLKKSLPATSMGRLDAHIQSEKRHMTVNLPLPQEGGQ